MRQAEAGAQLDERRELGFLAKDGFLDRAEQFAALGKEDVRAVLVEADHGRDGAVNTVKPPETSAA